MLSNLRLVIIVFFLLFLQTATLAQAKLGVGIGTGKIVIDENLRPGGVYALPSITVLNTGDIAAIYNLQVTYHKDQPELMPPAEWFTFSPVDFVLQPGDSQMVKIVLTIPLDAKPDAYFAYVEASPTNKVGGGETAVGIAAASKLYFSVDPANFLSGLWYRFTSLWKLYEPWTTRGAIFVGILLLFAILRNRVSLQVNLKKKEE